MDIFRSTIIRLPGITHAQVIKTLTDSSKACFYTDLRRKEKIRSINNQKYNMENCVGIEEVKTRLGKTKLVVSDCCQEMKVGCWWCREREGFQKNGMPISITSARNDNNEVETNILKRGYFCDDRCMYAFVCDRCIPGSPKYHTYKNAKYNAETLHCVKYPDKGSLIPAGNWEILKYNGGSMEYDCWKENSLDFKEIPGFVSSHASVKYSQI